jgi:hypothetical protein
MQPVPFREMQNFPVTAKITIFSGVTKVKTGAWYFILALSRGSNLPITKSPFYLCSIVPLFMFV